LYHFCSKDQINNKRCPFLFVGNEVLLILALILTG
jgi:hypothetical protein